MNYSSLKYRVKPLYTFITKTIAAKNRKLRSSYSIEALQDITVMHKIDLTKSVIDRMIDEV